nr:hypothetical protein CFP56_67052 [Quercus suber]
MTLLRPMNRLNCGKDVVAGAEISRKPCAKTSFRRLHKFVACPCTHANPHVGNNAEPVPGLTLSHVHPPSSTSLVVSDHRSDARHLGPPGAKPDPPRS